MTGGTYDSMNQSVQSTRPKESMTSLRYLLIITNTIFAVIYVIVTIWQSSIYWFFALFPPFYFVMLWVSYSSKLSEFGQLQIRGVHPELDLRLHIVGLFGNLIILIMVMVSIIVESTLNLYMVFPIFMVTLIDLENLGIFLAFNRITKNI
jgi:hypothetical protein